MESDGIRGLVLYFDWRSTVGKGVLDLLVPETPIAVIDFETTGLSPGVDRVVEVSVVRRDPGGNAEIVLDTLVNPRRPMGATEIHGITDADVADAPTFEEIAEGVSRAISGCVVAAYNVYFDMRFFDYEMQRGGYRLNPPHMCLMYLRPLLGLGPRCSLGEACQSHGVDYSGSHRAADDAEASAHLMEYYLAVMETEGIRRFHELSARGTYKFLRSFENGLLQCDAEVNRNTCRRSRSRRCQPDQGGTGAVPDILPQAEVKVRAGIPLYWDALKSAVADLEIDDAEIENLRRIAIAHGLRREQIRMLHGRTFASVITEFISDQWLDDSECRKLKRLHACLSRLGWAPGE